MTTAQDLEDNIGTRLYHVTAKKNLPSIIEHGLRANSYWSKDEDLSIYYEETVKDEDEVPVVLMIRLEDLDAKKCAPDLPGIEEPITTVLCKSEDDIEEEWRHSDKKWKDSLEIISSIKYKASIASEKLVVMEHYEHTHRLEDYIQPTNRMPSPR